jgi:Putative peptidoglycan binding domain
MEQTARRVLLVLLLLGSCASQSSAVDVELQQAQQQLSHLGYDAGEADGVYGPRTRQALEAFQHMQGLPATGILDEATRQGLESAVASTAIASPPPEVLSRSPLHVVVDYLRFHESQPGRVLQFVTEHFLNGMPPQVWVEQTIQTRLTRALTYVAWKVQGVETVNEQATVRVHTWVRVHGQEQARAEIFTLVRTLEGEWLVDAWQLEALRQEEPRPQAGSQPVERIPSLEGRAKARSGKL